jgi:hypothetical protein
METTIEGGSYLMIDDPVNGFELENVTKNIKNTQKKTGYPYIFSIDSTNITKKNQDSHTSNQIKLPPIAEPTLSTLGVIETQELRKQVPIAAPALRKQVPKAALPVKKPLPEIAPADNNYINGVMTMLLHAVEVKCLSYKTLKGFIFSVDVGKDLSGNVRDELQFFSASRQCISTNDIDCIRRNEKSGLSDNVPISKFLLKLIFLKNEKGSLNLPGLSAKLNKFKNLGLLGLFDDSENQRKIRKEKDDVKTFTEEAQNQQNLFKQEFFYEPVTYGILAACQIKPLDSMYLLHLLRSKANDQLTYQVIQAMVESRECKCPIGLIAMEYGENYEVLSKHVIQNNYETDETHKNRKCKLYANIFFKMLLLSGALTREKGFLHMDLHQNNIMVFKDLYDVKTSKLSDNIYNIKTNIKNSNEYNSNNIDFKAFTYIIDFGRIIETKLDYNFTHLSVNYSKRQDDIHKSIPELKKFVEFYLDQEFDYYKKKFGIAYIQSKYIFEYILDITNVINDGKLNINFHDINDKKNMSKLFYSYVNDLIHYYFVLHNPPNKKESKQIKKRGVKQDHLYTGKTYLLNKIDLDPDIGRIKDNRDGMILYNKVGINKKLNHFDLTTYANPGLYLLDSDIDKFKEIVKSNTNKPKLIKDLREALLTDNYIDLSNSYPIINNELTTINYQLVIPHLENLLDN